MSALLRALSAAVVADAASAGRLPSKWLRSEPENGSRCSSGFSAAADSSSPDLWST